MRFLYSTLLIVLLTLLAKADEVHQGYIFLPGAPPGTDWISCGKYIASIEGTKIGQGRVWQVQRETYYDEAWLYQAWTKGYISGINQVSTKQIHTDWAGVQLWLKNYCMAHPTENYVSAVYFFVRENQK